MKNEHTKYLGLFLKSSFQTIAEYVLQIKSAALSTSLMTRLGTESSSLVIRYTFPPNVLKVFYLSFLFQNLGRQSPRWLVDAQRSSVSFSPVRRETQNNQDNTTWMQPVLRVPDGDAVAMEILLPRPVHFELHVHLPVLQVARLQPTRQALTFVWKTFFKLVFWNLQNNFFSSFLTSDIKKKKRIRKVFHFIFQIEVNRKDRMLISGKHLIIVLLKK